MKRVLANAVTALALGLMALGCGARSEWKPGGLYSVDNGDGSFGIAKVLAIDPGVISVRMYKQSYAKRPQKVEPASLSLGSVDDPDGFGIGHMPLDEETFASWKPALLVVVSVEEVELDGYRMWQEASGSP
jgi:hypothetical protein